MVQIIAIIVFVVAYIGITIEHITHVHKSALALAAGGLLWIIVGASGIHLEHSIIETGYEIFSITVFLLGAMALVEILIHYGFFDAIRNKLNRYNLDTRKQFWVVTGIVFVLSAIVDNLTATIIAIQIARKFFWGRNLLVAAVGIVIAANAGGAFSPIGDVTTIMLWVAGKFSTGTLIQYTFIPALIIYFVSTCILQKKVTVEARIEDMSEKKPEMTRSDILVICMALLSFFMPVAAKAIHLPPVIGIIFGVGLTWTMVDSCKKLTRKQSHLSATIDSLIQKVDIASIKFFIGILLAVSALSTLGILNYVSSAIYGTGESIVRIIAGNTLTGLISSVLDNIPLTAIAIKSLTTTDPVLWTLLALSVGTGGSLLAIGSAAGVVATGMVKELTFKEYLKIAWLPALLSFFAGIGMWLLLWELFK